MPGGPAPSAASTSEGPSPSTPSGDSCPHVADARLGGESARGIGAGAVDSDDLMLEAERVQDLGHRSAHGYDPAGVGDRHQAAGRVSNGHCIASYACCNRKADNHCQAQAV